MAGADATIVAFWKAFIRLIEYDFTSQITQFILVLKGSKHLWRIIGGSIVDYYYFKMDTFTRAYILDKGIQTLMCNLFRIIGKDND